MSIRGWFFLIVFFLTTAGAITRASLELLSRQTLLDWVDSFVFPLSRPLPYQVFMIYASPETHRAELALPWIVLLLVLHRIYLSVMASTLAVPQAFHRGLFILGSGGVVVLAGALILFAVGVVLTDGALMSVAMSLYRASATAICAAFTLTELLSLKQRNVH